MSDGNGLAEALLGLDGFRVLAVVESVSWWWLSSRWLI